MKTTGREKHLPVVAKTKGKRDCKDLVVKYVFLSYPGKA